MQDAIYLLDAINSWTLATGCQLKLWELTSLCGGLHHGSCSWIPYVWTSSYFGFMLKEVILGVFHFYSLLSGSLHCKTGACKFACKYMNSVIFVFILQLVYRRVSAVCLHWIEDTPGHQPQESWNRKLCRWFEMLNADKKFEVTSRKVLGHARLELFIDEKRKLTCSKKTSNKKEVLQNTKSNQTQTCLL